MKSESIVNIINALEKNNINNSFIPISEISNNEEEVTYILTNTNIFFCASKSRIILVHWLCEKIRTIFEKNNYEPLDMNNEVYEELRKIFNTKAFNKNEYLKLFNCEKKSIMKYEQFCNKEEIFIDSYNKLVPNEMKLSKINHIFLINKDCDIDLLGELNSIIKKDRQEEVLYFRALGYTLDQIGNKFGITRERARQIEIKPKALIERWMDNRKDEILKFAGDDILIDSKKAEKYFGERFWSIMKYSSKENKNKFSNWHYIFELDTIIYSKNNDFYSDIIKILEKASEKSFTEDKTISLINEKYPFFDVKLLRKFCKNSKFNIYNNIIYNSKLNIGKSILVAAETDYSDGIDIGNKEKLNEFANYLNKNFGLKVKPNRALTARIQDILIMSDNTIYKSQKFISKTDTLDNKIKNYMKNLSTDRSTYQQMFDAIPKEILKEHGIDTYSGLHGYIKKFEDKLNVISLRYYVCKKNVENLLSEGFFVELSNWLLENGKPVSVEDILNKFDGWTDMYPKYAMLYFPEIAQWAKNVYINLKTIDVKSDEKTVIKSILDESIDNKLKYTNAYIIYDKVSSKLPDLIKRNNITTESQLFNVIKYNFNDMYLFTKPHILSLSVNKENYSTEDLLHSIIGRKDSICKSDMIHDLRKYYGNKNSSLALAIQKVMKEFIRINPNQYYKKSRIKFTDKDFEMITKYINDNLIDGKYIIPNKLTNFDKLPKAPFKWNSWSVCEVLKLYDNDFVVLNKRNNIMNNTMVIVTKDSGFNTKETLLSYIIETKYDGNTKEELDRFVKNLGIFSSNINIEEE